MSNISLTEKNNLDGFSVEKYHAGFCVKNDKNEYLWFGSDDGEDEHYFFSDSPRRTKACEYSDTVTCYSNTLNGALSDLKKYFKQELENENDIPPMEVYKLK